MSFFPYLCILTLASTIHFNKSSFISSFDHGPIHNEANILHSKRSLGTKLSGVKRRIIGGHFVKDIKQYPYMAYLLRKTKIRNATHVLINSEVCGATLLSPTHALTAAHCFRKCSCSESVDDKNCRKCMFHRKENYTIFAGSTVANYSVDKSKLKNVYIHPEHTFVDLTHKCIHRFDIAVIELATPVKFNDKISKIKLPKPVTLGRDNLNSTFTSTFFNKGECLIIGWGFSTKKDNKPFLHEKLQVAKVPLIGLEKCESEIQFNTHKGKNILNTFVCTDTDICSKSNNDKTGTCGGDSGGPIICGGVQVGVTSWGRSKCVGLHSPTMYTRVEVCAKWIRDVMSGKNITGRYMKIK